MGVTNEIHYDEDSIAFLETIWGEGYLSPGGPAEVARLLESVDLTGKRGLDIGCGVGGVTVALVRDHSAGSVIGIDVEAPVCRAARKQVEAKGLSDRIEIRQVEPGPLPLEAGSLDFVFSKDAIIHITDKEALAEDVYRVLKPGGFFIASDWMIAHDDTPSPEMAAYIAAEDLDFGMASPDRYRRALAGAGFEEVVLTNRNAWYREEAASELALLTGPKRAAFEAKLGEAQIARQIRTWELMVPVLKSGEHCPHHLFARKPG
ncbi:MAG: methyltransferase domain-containing protein [Pseudomonadota bacterium]